MLNQTTHWLINKIANHGYTEENLDCLHSLCDTYLELPSLESGSLANIMTLLLLIEFDELPFKVRRVATELRHRIVRDALGVHYRHGIALADKVGQEYQKNILSKVRKSTTYENGQVIYQVLSSVQQNALDDRENPFNDIFQLVLNTEKEERSREV